MTCCSLSLAVVEGVSSRGGDGHGLQDGTENLTKGPREREMERSPDDTRNMTRLKGSTAGVLTNWMGYL